MYRKCKDHCPVGGAVMLDANRRLTTTEEEDIAGKLKRMVPVLITPDWRKTR